jgi:hypothetical protein
LGGPLKDPSFHEPLCIGPEVLTEMKRQKLDNLSYRLTQSGLQRLQKRVGRPARSEDYMESMGNFVPAIFYSGNEEE